MKTDYQKWREAFSPCNILTSPSSSETTWPNRRCQIKSCVKIAPTTVQPRVALEVEDYW
jgi:hypothetical protein